MVVVSFYQLTFEQETRSFPSCEKATWRTSSVWSVSDWTRTFGTRSTSRSYSSRQQAAPGLRVVVSVRKSRRKSHFQSKLSRVICGKKKWNIKIWNEILTHAPYIIIFASKNMRCYTIGISWNILPYINWRECGANFQKFEIFFYRVKLN